MSSGATAPLLSPSPVEIRSESGPLLSVVLGDPDTYPRTIAPSQIINQTIRETAETGAMPSRDSVRAEFEAVRGELEACGVEVLYPSRVDGAFYQLFTRDLAFVIGGDVVLSNMAKECRRPEQEGIRRLLDRAHRVHRIPDGESVEGGDVVVDGEKVYVGMSERTTIGAVRFLKKLLPDYDFIPVPIRKPEKGWECLHLDCAFVPLGNGCALLYRDAFPVKAETLFGERDYIEVTTNEQHALATNVLCLSPSAVMTRDRTTRVNDELARRGFEVKAMKFDGAPALGGSLRCCTLPLRRGGV